MELKRLLEALPPDLSEDASSTKKFKKRQSLVKFRQDEQSYTNENFVSDEEIAGNKGLRKDRTSSSSDRGEIRI